jgi:hypothetical protein
MMRDAAGGRRFVREPGRLERGWALAAWEDGGSAVLQVGAACRDWERLVDDAGCRRGTLICAGAGPFGSGVGSDRMGRRRKRRTPSWGRPPGLGSVWLMTLCVRTRRGVPSAIESQRTKPVGAGPGTCMSQPGIRLFRRLSLRRDPRNRSAGVGAGRLVDRARMPAFMVAT